MPECRIVAPDIPVDPEEALPFLKHYCASNKADLVIGTSMGGMYAMQLTDYPRVCVNPALRMTELKDILKPGTFEYFQPTADGRTHFSITEETIRHFKTMEQHMFDGITDKNQQNCWGVFADGDTLVNYKGEFSEHFNNIYDFHGEHRMNNNVMRDIIIPFVRNILNQDTSPHRKQQEY
jgi:predicted esterase YcpF (UPF0227 family)